MTDSKASRKAPKAPEVGKTAAASEAPLIQAAAPKPVRKRAPAVAKVAPAKEEKPAAAAPASREMPGRKAARVMRAVVVPAPREEAKPAKVKKARLVRDSFTMPESEYAAIAELKKRCLDSGVAAKKSEILRAAISALARLSDAKVVAAIQGLAAIKTGRPAKDGK